MITSTMSNLGGDVESDRYRIEDVPPVRVDLLTSISGVTWDEAHAGRVSGHYGDVSVDYIGRDEFIANKRASGRARDMADLESLGEA